MVSPTNSVDFTARYNSSLDFSPANTKKVDQTLIKNDKDDDYAPLPSRDDESYDSLPSNSTIYSKKINPHCNTNSNEFLPPKESLEESKKSYPIPIENKFSASLIRKELSGLGPLILKKKKITKDTILTYELSLFGKKILKVIDFLKKDFYKDRDTAKAFPKIFIYGGFDLSKKSTAYILESSPTKDKTCPQSIKKKSYELHYTDEDDRKINRSNSTAYKIDFSPNNATFEKIREITSFVRKLHENDRNFIHANSSYDHVIVAYVIEEMMYQAKDNIEAYSVVKTTNQALNLVIKTVWDASSKIDLYNSDEKLKFTYDYLLYSGNAWGIYLNQGSADKNDIKRFSLNTKKNNFN